MSTLKTSNLQNEASATVNVVLDTSGGVTLGAALPVGSGGTGATSAASARTSLGLGNVENTALSTWAGSTNITTVGTIATGTWSGSTIAVNKGGTGVTTLTGIVKGNGTSAFTAAAAGTDYQAPIGTISGIAKGNGANALTAASVGTDYSLLTAATAVASTSGQVIDFGSIPSGVKRITVILSAVSTNGTSNLLIQIGDSGGVENTGYSGGSVNFTNGSLGMQNLGGSGFSVFDINAATAVHHAAFTLTNITGNTWVCAGLMTRSDNTRATYLTGTKTLSATLDRVRVTTNNGTDSFDAGTVNIFYEY